jgi:hypothetical protein
MYEHDDLTQKTLSAVRRSVTTTELPPPPSARRIIARGQARRHRRWSAAALTAVSATAIAAVAITVSGHAHPNNATALKLGSKQVHVELAGYSINSDTRGRKRTVTITVTNAQSMDPAYMEKVLAQAGVAAVIRVGSFCSTNTQPDGFSQVVSDTQGPENVMVITPSAMPQGAELSIGYFPDHVAFTLISAAEPLTCVTSDQPSNPNVHPKPLVPPASPQHS